MKEFIFIFQQIFAVFLAFFASYIFRLFRKKIDLTTISEIIIYLASPCLILTKIATTQYQISQLAILSSSIVFVMVGVMGINLVLGKFVKLGKTFKVATVFMNTANVGFPVTLFVLGSEAFAQAIIIDLTMILILFSVGIGYISGKFTEIFKTPVLYAAAIGFFFSFSPLDIPELIFKPLALIGELTVPLMVVSLGCKIAELTSISKLKLAFLATAVRSFGGFILGLIFVGLTGITGTTRLVILLYSALPAPIMSYILAQKYHEDEKLAAEIVLLSNLSAVIILPVIIYLIMNIGI